MTPDTTAARILELLQHDARAPTADRVVTALTVAFAVALFVVALHRWIGRGALAARGQDVAIVLTAMVTALIIVPISSNITLSLGMVGALSIVRFRMAYKDPLDILFTFWAIAVGVAAGAGFYVVSVVGSLVIGLALALMTLVRFRRDEPYLLVVRFDPAAEPAVLVAAGGVVRSKSRTPHGAEMTIEVRVRGGDTSVLDRVVAIPGVTEGSLVSTDGDVVA